MLVFLDESGDAGLKLDKGSTPFFIVSLVIINDHDEAKAIDTRISLLRRELGLKEDFEFHFVENKHRHRVSFLEAVQPYDWFYLSIVIDKSKLYGPGFRFRSPFYKYTCSLVFENAKPYLDEATVLVDGSGSREFRRQLESYLKRKINDNESDRRFIKKVKVQSAAVNNLLQLADMVSGAVHRSYKGGKEENMSYRKLISPREIYVQRWPK